MVFQRTYIYVKEHNETGLKYFGKTCKENYVKYRGSGIRWTHHINKYGYDVSTKLLGIYDNQEECVIFCLAFSKINNIVQCNKWANLIDENGCDGGVFGSKHSEESKMKMSIAKLNMSDETKIKMSKCKIGKIHNKESKMKMSIAKLKMSDKTKMKMSIAKLNMSYETKMKMSKSQIGRKHSDETKMKMSKSQMGRKLSEETKMKMSKSQMGRKLSEETKMKMKNRPKIYKCYFCKSQKMSKNNFIQYHSNGKCLFNK